MGLKGNQSHLHEAVEDFFSVAYQHDFKGIEHNYVEEVEKDHGRFEVRRYWVSDQLETLPDTALWEGLNSIGMVERECTQGESHSIEKRYFINSIKPDDRLFAKAVREQWGVENPLHWRLDVIMDDESCIKKGNGATIMTTF